MSGPKENAGPSLDEGTGVTSGLTPFASKWGLTPFCRSGGLDFDAAGLGFRGLRNGQLEDAVLELGLDGVGLDVLGQREGADELAVDALDTRVMAVVALLLEV